MVELRCPACGSNQIYTRKRDKMRRCKTCGYEWPEDAVLDGIADAADADDDEPPLDFDDRDDEGNTLEPDSSNDDLSYEK